MFPAFVKNPLNFKFQGQDADEEIVLVIRAHPITNLAWIIPAIAVFLIPFFVPNFIQFINLDFPPLSPNFSLALLIINFLLVLVITFEGFLNWYFNVNILTNERLIDVDFSNILLNNQDIAMLSDIQEVSPSRAGLLGLIFDLGDVVVQTAGARVGIDMIKVPRPYEVADMILEQAEKAKETP